MQIKIKTSIKKDLLSGLLLIALAASVNLILHKNIPLKSSGLDPKYKIEQADDAKMLKKLEANPQKALMLNFLGLGFIAAFILGIANIFLINNKIYNRQKALAQKRRFDFPKAIPFSKAILLLSTVYLWFTISKQSQLMTMIYYRDIDISFNLVMTFIVQALSIVSILGLTDINFVRIKSKLIKQIPAVFNFYFALIPSSMLLASLSAIVADKLSFPIEPMPLIEIMASGELSKLSYILLAIEAVIFAPIFEELLFRGVIFAALRSKFSFGFSALVSAIIFSVLHEHYLSFLPILLLAVVFSYLYERTKNLAYPILLHMIYNGFSLLSVSLLKDIIN